MPFQNILIDVGEETAVTFPIADPFIQMLRNEAIAGFEKFNFTIQQDNKIIPNPALFATVGGKLHGASPISPMRTILEQLFSPMNQKLFTVVNRNTAHHMSYFLSDFAFRHFGDYARKKVVINIDQHEDYGSGTSPAKFLSWGKNVITNTTDGLCYNIETFNTYTDVTYIIVGIFSLDNSAAKKEECKFKDISSKTIQRKQNAVTIGDMKKILINKEFKDFNIDKEELYPEIIRFFINEIFGEKIKGGTVPQNSSDTDYYITLDTDAMWGSNTCYPSGTLNQNAVLTLINEIFKKIVEYKDFLTGFDVTGLPINDNPQKNPFDFSSYNASFLQTSDVIFGINQMLEHYKL